MQNIEGLTPPIVKDIEGLTPPIVKDIEGLTPPIVKDIEGSIMPTAQDIKGSIMPIVQDIEGLIPAIVQDYYTGRVLMLAYVNQESYDFMLENGETCFWSRSRNALWHKGKTSGNVQKIKHMAWDCDKDTLLITVEQTGSGACHTGEYSCFGEVTCDFNITDNVHAQIEDRSVNPKDKSYTNYLLDEGIDKICKKIGEEAAEVIISAKNADKDAVIEEIADLGYHLLVLMFTQGITPRDIKAKLAQRFNKKSNLKVKNCAESVQVISAQFLKGGAGV